MLGIATTIFVIVQGLLLYSIIRFGRQPGDESDGPPIRGNTRLEFIWTADPGADRRVHRPCLAIRCWPTSNGPRPASMTSKSKRCSTPGNSITPTRISRPRSCTSARPPGAAEAALERCDPFFLGARVPHQEGCDARSGHDDLYHRRSRLGTYPIVCTELCGAGHAVMRSQVVVESDADFKHGSPARGGAKQQAQAAAAADPLAAGKQVFNSYGCNACHALTDPPAPPADRAEAGWHRHSRRERRSRASRPRNTSAHRLSSPMTPSRRAIRPTSCPRTTGCDVRQRLGRPGEVLVGTEVANQRISE